MKRIMLFTFLTLLFNITAQNVEREKIVVKQIGKHFEKNFLNLKLSSKKIYYFEPNGYISKVLRYGRYHYYYLSILGRVTNYQYVSNFVIETDTLYQTKSNEIFNVTVDTLSLEFILRKTLDNSKNNQYDSCHKLIQSENDFNQVKKYEYNNQGLITRITYYSKHDNILYKNNQLAFRWKKFSGLSKATIEKLNNFILWQHELGI